MDRITREYPAIGSNRVRLLSTPRGPALDVREYVQAEGFEGFTRRGIRLDMAQARALYDVLAQLLDVAPVPAPALEMPKALRDIIAIKTATDRYAEQHKPKPARKAPAPKASSPAPSGVLSPALDEIRARMRRGETVPLTGPGSLAEALASQKAAPVAPAPVRIDVDRKTPDGQRLGDALLSGILEQTMRATG